MAHGDRDGGTILALFGVGVGAIVVTGAGAAGALWLLDRLGVNETAVRLPVLLIISVMGLLLAIAVLVAAFRTFELANPREALGLPEGSVRAMIALMLILLFAIATLYIYGTITPANSDVGKQLITTLGTLVVAVAAFYFGSKAVQAGISATKGPSAAPGVVTGTAQVDGSTAVLKGVVNPSGRSTTGHFEYGLDTTYGNDTDVQTVGSGTDDVEVSAAVSRLTGGTPYHYRLVAESTGGTTRGTDRTFTTS